MGTIPDHGVVWEPLSPGFSFENPMDHLLSGLLLYRITLGVPRPSLVLDLVDQSMATGVPMHAFSLAYALETMGPDDDVFAKATMDPVLALLDWSDHESHTIPTVRDAPRSSDLVDTVVDPTQQLAAYTVMYEESPFWDLWHHVEWQSPISGDWKLTGFQSSPDTLITTHYLSPGPPRMHTVHPVKSCEACQRVYGFELNNTYRLAREEQTKNLISTLLAAYSGIHPEMMTHMARELWETT